MFIQIHLTTAFKFNQQDPAQADKILKIQRELDETKIILVRNSYEVDISNLALFPLPCLFFSWKRFAS